MSTKRKEDPKEDKKEKSRPFLLCDLCALCGEKNLKKYLWITMKIIKKLATKLHKGTRRKENLCYLRNLWFLIFIRLRVKLAS